MASDQPSRTAASLARRTIPSKLKKGGAPLGNVPKNRRPSSQPELVGQRFGSVKIISPDVMWLGAKERRFMHCICECVTCGYRSVISHSNLVGGRTLGCRRCNQPKADVPAWLVQRTQAMHQRCRNPNTQGWENYGGRGIEFRFESPTICALWIVKNLGLPSNARDLELDRKENDGHYEPGNIRWATKLVNLTNRRTTKWTPLMHAFKIRHPEVRYADSSLRALISAGLSDEQIVARWLAPSMKPKGKYGTCSTADPEIASLAKAC